MIVRGLIVALLLAHGGVAYGQVCEPSDTAETLQYLRRLSLDLRGHLPTLDELDSVVANGSLDPGIIDEMLASDAFDAQIRRWHVDLLWTNLRAQQLAAVAYELAPPTDRGPLASPAYWVPAPTRTGTRRGARVPCKDEPAVFDEEAQNWATTPHPTVEGARQEGYLMVRPYWDPSAEVKVCAFDAREDTVITLGRNRTNDCRNRPHAWCGCGPNLAWCQLKAAANNTRVIITESMKEQLLRFVAEVVREGRPYTDILLAKDMEINGPLVHYYRNQGETGIGKLFSGSEQNHELPDLQFHQQDEWVRVTRGLRHSGVLTMPGYLARFMTNRSRANRFRNAFLCNPFQAPEGGLPPAEDACHDEPDLSKRCGCYHCHVLLEPLAAHWGRWVEAGVKPLNEEEFPDHNPACLTAEGKDDHFCKRLYLLEAEHPDEEAHLGKLLSYVFADDLRKENIGEGPEKLARSVVENGEFARCTSRRLMERLLNLNETAADDPMVMELKTAFIDGGYDYRALVKALVTRPEYVQAGRYRTEEVEP